MDGTEYTEDSKRLSFNFSGDSGHSSGIEPNVSLVHPCGNSSCEKYRRPGCPYSTTELVLIVMVTGCISLTTILGNALVMLSIKVNRQLQTVNNYFLFSLACADLIIGLLSMNLYTLYIIMGYWPLGPVACDLWLALDYMVSNASVMNLLVISFDRYFCVTRPLTYPARRTTRLAGLMIAAAWVLSFILWAPAILFWQSFVGKRIVPDGECYIQLLSNPTVTLGTTLPSFYLPAVIMIILYTRISLASHRRLTEIQSESKRARTSSGLLKHWRSCVSSQPDIVTKPKSDSDKLNEIVSVEGETSVCPKQRVKERNKANKITQLSIVHNGSSTSDNQPRTLLYTASFSTCQTKRRRRFETREKKMTKIIFAILLVFILTWTPYSVMAVIGTFCHSCVSDTVWTMGYWLCYINSTINPGCYALCNVTFRKTFRNLLRCQYKNMGRK